MRRGRRSATKIKFFFNFLFPLCPESIWDRRRRGRSQSSRCLLVARLVGFGMGRRRERPRPPPTTLPSFTAIPRGPPSFSHPFYGFFVSPPLPSVLKRGGVSKRFGGGGRGGGPICNPPPCCPPADTHFPILPPPLRPVSLPGKKTLALAFFYGN